MITPLPTPPTRQDPENFSVRADSFLGALPAFVTEANALLEEVDTNTSTVATNLATTTSLTAEALQHKLAAETAAGISLATSNFKGNWSALSGSLNTPASVMHQYKIWILLNNLASVSTSEPGVSQDWQPIFSHELVTQVMTGSVSPAVPGVRYICRNIAHTITLPQVITKGATFSFLNETQEDGALVYTNGHKFRGVLPVDNVIEFNARQMVTMVYEDSTTGLY